MNGNERATRTSGTTDRSLTEEVAVVGAGPTWRMPRSCVRTATWRAAPRRTSTLDCSNSWHGRSGFRLAAAH